MEAKRSMSSFAGSLVSLRQVLADGQLRGTSDVQVTRVTCDSRACQPGDLFVAIAGGQHDGHDYIAEAVARGAVAVVAQRPTDAAAPVFQVPDSREALGRICQAMALWPSQTLKVIGVTGTNGKTTTSHLIASILRAAGQRTTLLGTLGADDDDLYNAPGLTTPPAAELAQWLARAVTRGCSHAVLEVSSHAAAQRRVAGIEFAHLVLTNLRRDHLDYHGSVAEYHFAKTSLFGQLASRGVAVVNADDPASAECLPLIPGGVLTFGRQRSAQVTATLVERFKSEQTFLLTAGEATVPVRTAMIGDHHIANCLAAATVALAEGIDLATIARGLEAVGHVPGRLERIECGQPFGVYVDFAHTSDALEVVLKTLREVTAGRLLCVFGAGGNRDVSKRPAMGHAVEQHADIAVVTTDNPRSEDPRGIAAEILRGFRNPTAARWIPDRQQAIHYALSLAGADDVVLIAGRGHETWQHVADEHLPLDDREVARRYLYNLEPSSRYGSLMSVANS